jgi:hypothetical protein
MTRLQPACNPPSQVGGRKSGTAALPPPSGSLIMDT